MGDAHTQAALRKLADEYIVQAEQIESEENTATMDGASLVVPSKAAGALSDDPAPVLC
jgi:ribosomal 30S subunit maturation factor RimM